MPRKGSLDTCTVLELKAKAAKRGIKVTCLNKAEIIAKLRGKQSGGNYPCDFDDFAEDKTSNTGLTCPVDTIFRPYPDPKVPSHYKPFKLLDRTRSQTYDKNKIYFKYLVPQPMQSYNAWIPSNLATTWFSQLSFQEIKNNYYASRI